ncbi:argininosuccinate synthase domain-containing protein [Chloroflexota bacterium]
MTEKVILAYSGGLDTSVAIKWLQEKYHLDVIAVTIDVGNEPEKLCPAWPASGHGRFLGGTSESP